jgi:hypothetical protein
MTGTTVLTLSRGATRQDVPGITKTQSPVAPTQVKRKPRRETVTWVRVLVQFGHGPRLPFQGFQGEGEREREREREREGGVGRGARERSQKSCLVWWNSLWP